MAASDYSPDELRNMMRDLQYEHIDNRCDCYSIPHEFGQDYLCSHADDKFDNDN